ncbi:MAG: NUDIX domain-containing protein [Clostridia bacterium]|nr:NUDIX domain-containing protein [Clostridia bacterium]
MEEYWDVYDKFREKTGKIIKRDSDQWLKNGEYHIVITGIIQNSKKQILISKRKEDKKVYPGLWECTGGSAKVGESSISAALREIEEELGINLQNNRAIFLKTIKGSNYFRDVWLFKKDIKSDDIKFNDGEVVDAKWVSIREYEELYKNGKIIPTGKFVIDLLEEREKEEER